MRLFHSFVHSSAMHGALGLALRYKAEEKPQGAGTSVTVKKMSLF